MYGQFSQDKMWTKYPILLYVLRSSSDLISASDDSVVQAPLPV